MAASSRQVVQIAIALALLAVAGALLFRPRTASSIRGVYYYDLGAKRLYVKGPGSPAPTGESVPAAVFACSSCADASTHFVAYLTKESEEYRQLVASGVEPTPQQVEAGRLVRAVDDDAWAPASSEAGMRLMMSVNRRCPADKPAMVCLPE